MPIYEYACDSCGHRFERLVRIGAEPPPCPECASAVRKLVSQSGFILRGGGWYKDHYGLKKSDGGESSKKGEGAGESKGDGESKSGESKGGEPKGGESTGGGESPKKSEPAPAAPAESKPKPKAVTSTAAAK